MKRWCATFSCLFFTLSIATLVFSNLGFAQQDVQKWLLESKDLTLPSDLAPLVEDVRLSIEFGQKLTQDLSENAAPQQFNIQLTKTPPETLAVMRQQLSRALAAIDLGAYQKKDWERFHTSLVKAQAALSPVARFAKGYHVFVLGNAHIDMAWLWRWQETVEVCRATFAQQLQLMKDYPEFIFAQSQAQAYLWTEERYPELFAAIQDRVKAGQWEVVGGMVVEPDCNLIDGESWVRQLLYGKNYFQSRFGVDIQIGWNPDSFGYNWNMPQFLQKSGIHSYITQKISWNDTNVFPYHLFWWEGADGSRVLTYFPYTGYDGSLTMDDVVTNIRKNEANTGRKEVLVLFGMGDHGGGPERQMLDNLRTYQQLTVFPQISFIKAQDFLNRLTEAELVQLPVWKDELYLEYHRGTYTTQANIKKANRKNEILLANAEKLSAVSMQFGNPYPKEELKTNWWKLLFNQFHDILPGSSIAPVYRDAKEQHAQITAAGKEMVRTTLAQLAAQIQIKERSKQEKFLLVMNPLSWQRNDPVEVSLEPGANNFRVREMNGSEVPSQLRQDETGRHLVFLAQAVPSLGYKVYRLQSEANRPITTPKPSDTFNLENRYFQIKVDPKSGNLVSIYDRQNQREVLDGSGEGNMIHLFGDVPKRWDAWEIGYTGEEWKLNQADRLQLLDDGAVFTRLRVEKSFLGASKSKYQPTESFPSSFFIQDVILYHDLPFVEVRMQADWWEEHVLAKVELSIAVANDFATYEIPFATVTRPTTNRTSWDKARYEVPALRWADLSDSLSAPGYGVSLINDCKYGYDVHDNRMRLTLLRSPKNPDPTADLGKHEFKYSIYPHAGDWRQAGTVRMAHQFNTPLLTHWLTPAKGKLPTTHSFFSLSPERVILADIKLAENGDGLIFRFYESQGQPGEVSCTLWQNVASAVAVDFMETESQPVRFAGNKVSFSVQPYEIQSIKIRF